MKGKNRSVLFVVLSLFLLLIAGLCLLYMVFREKHYSLEWWYNRTEWNELEDNCGEETIIAVIDTGVNIEHEALKGSVWFNPAEIVNGVDDDHNGYIDDINGWNFIDNNNDVTESEISHGTAVSGLIIAGHKQIGVASFAPIKLMILKVLDDYGESEKVDELIAAIQYAENHGATICNCSFGMEQYSEDLYRTIAQSKMLFVASAGNAPQGQSLNKKDYYPAKYDLPNIIVVSASDEQGDPWIHSNYGSGVVDLYSRGVELYTCSVDGYDYCSGVSMSVPQVTGVAGIIRSYGQYQDPISIKKILLDYFTEVDPELEPYCKKGNCLIN